MSDDHVTWLKQEVSDLLDVSSVGLYEFIWLLRSRTPPVTDAAARSIAERALAELLAADLGRLVWLVWPSEKCLEGSDSTELSSADWDDPVDGQPYPAISRS